MTTEYQYPSSAELIEIAQDKMPRLTAARPILTEFPIVDADAPLLMWEQQDNYQGLQQIRGINGQPPSVRKVGAKRYIEQPGVYGEFELIDEQELTNRRQWGSFNAPINVSDLVMLSQDRLLGRRLDRIEKVLWDLVINGTFSVAGPSGGTLASGAYTTQTYDATTWGTATTATPLTDLRAVALKARGHSVNFGAPASAYMNMVTANKMLANTNAADLGGRRGPGLSTLNSIPQIAQLLGGENLPTIVVYDEGYMAEATVQDALGTFTPFIPDNVVIVIGQRPAGQVIGNYRMTRNANNPGLAPGPYMKVKFDQDDVPPQIEVHDGHSGGPVIYYPSAIVVMDVS